MTQFIVAAAGAAVGFAVGGPAGAQVGWMVGSSVGASMGPGQSVQGPRLDLKSLRAPKLQYGAPWPRVYGRIRTAGIILWQSDLRPVATTTEQGGKGGGPAISTTTFTYYRDILIGLAAGTNVIAITRVWCNGELIWSALADSDAATIAASAATIAWEDMLFYDGNPAQLPDPTYEAAVGTANAQGWRHRSTVMLKGVNQGGFEQAPLFEFEIITKAELAQSDALVLLQVRGIDGFNDESSYEVPYVIQTDSSPGIHIDNGVIVVAAQTLKIDFITWQNASLLKLAGDPFTVQGRYVAPSLLSVSDSGGSNFIVSLENVSGWWAVCSIGAYSGLYEWQPPAGYFVRFETSTGHGGQFDATAAGHVAFEYSGGANGTLWFYLNGVPVVSIPYADPPMPPGVGAYSVVRTGCGYWSRNPNHGTSYTVDNIRYELRSVWGGVAFEPPLDLEPVDGQLTTYSPLPEDLADVVTAECAWNGLDASLIDVSQLVGHDVYGIACAGSARETAEFLMPAYSFGAVCSNVLEFVRFGGASAATLAYASTGVGVDKANDTPFTGPARDNDPEVPAKVALTYVNLDADYDAGTEQADRLIGVSNKVEQINLPLVWTGAFAKGAAETIAVRGRIETMGGKIQLGDEWAKLQPTDPFDAITDEGVQVRGRIEETMYADGVSDHRYVLDDASAIQRIGVTSANYTPVITVQPPGEAELVLIDGPILRDVDNDPGLYAAIKGSGNYRGAVLFKSPDGITYAPQETWTNQAVIGEAINVLGDWTEGDKFDEMNSFIINLGNDATLSSSTRAAMLLDQSINAAVIGADTRWEVVQFRDAVLVSSSPNIYMGTGLLRGRRGTEYAMGNHAIGDTFVLLQTAGIRRIAMDTGELALDRYWKGVAAGRNLSSATAQVLSNDGVGLKPFAPVDFRVARDVSNNCTLTWIRRTRLQDRFGGVLGDSVPLGEASEEYEVDIFTSDDYAIVARSITGITAPTTTYSAAEQTADGLTPGDPIYARVHQISAVVNRGYALEAAA